MPADQIFVLVLVVGIVLGLGWLAMGSRRRAEVEQKRREEAAAAAAAESAALDAGESARPDRRRGRRR